MTALLHFILQGWSWFFTGVMVFYLLLMILLCLSWVRMKRHRAIRNPDVRVSVIIPARNEEGHILACLQSLSEQDYPSDLLQIVLVDDDSDDQTPEIIAEFIRQHSEMNIRLLRLEHDASVKAHKKRALTQGIAHSDGELILTTDADCMAGPEWIRAMASFYQATKPALIIGPVAFHKEHGLFGRMQSLEYAGLMMVSGASAALKNPLLCSGANLAYPRLVFDAVMGYSGDDEPSGDDVLLMQRVQKMYPDGIRFLKSEKAIVWTSPQENVMAFISQRRRWSSKLKRYRPGAITATAILVFLCNALMLTGALVCLIHPAFVRLYLILAGGKLIIDFLFLFLGISFLHRKALIWVYLPEQIVYSFYVVVSVCLGFKKGYSWKGRKV